MNFILDVCGMKKTKSVGRPKMAEKLKKVRFSIKQLKTCSNYLLDKMKS